MGVPTPTVEFGQRVRFRRCDARYRTTSDRWTMAYSYWKTWARRTWLTEDPVEGIVIGVRTLNDGWVSYAGESTSYRPKEWYPAYIVAYDLRRSPVIVLPEDCELLA